MNKHAFLIIAHDKYEQLAILLQLLDDYRNDIYIHIDKKSPHLDDSYIKNNKSSIYVIPDEQRIDVRWGDVSMVQCELLLYYTAYKQKEYKYYHLISGHCLPIKSNDFIHDFCENHSGINFIGIGQYNKDTFINRVAKKHYLTKYYKIQNDCLRFGVSICRHTMEIAFNILSKKYQSKIEYKKGCQWCSLTSGFVEYMLGYTNDLLQHYKRAYCPDEIYKQTLIYNSPYRDSIYNIDDEFKSCLRLIDWERGFPYVWKTDEDINIINSSPCFFARKFDIDNYSGIIDKVISLVINK